ncbi:Bacteroides conjugation system ATPase, TraG family [Mucilaginibacter pineti]|uniref:Bacteroides conjugation system ATPase, TraG family n=1 Tax=Mucilaginibacter pineti TaxID=1391627 RepID=A0A1G7EQ98_9SPHI|nr:TraG family conjugative transposon ATPase [Mucilaginibacter pineti]SDE65870.1 Bacteroides conjugation system ATPase, TraG family [Mucilaginibacter pineti]
MTPIAKIFPIYKVQHDALISAWGDITVVYQVSLPDIFTLSGADYETFHQSFIRAIRVLPKHSIFHKKDVYTRQKYAGSGTEQSFLADAAERHFSGRQYLDHVCYILLTKKAEDRKACSSALSGLMRKSIVPKQLTDAKLFPAFLEKTGQFERILSDSGLIGLRKLSGDELAGTADQAGLLESYCFNLGAGERPVIKDVHLKERLQVGDQIGQLFTLGDAEDLPALCGSRIDYGKYSTDRTRFSVGFTSGLGLLLDCDHTYNQYIFIEDAQKTLKGLEAKKRRLQSLSAYSRENAIARDATNDFLNEAISQARLPVKAHFNVIAWTDDRERLQEIRNQVSSAMAQIGATAKQESDGAGQIWWSGIPGNAADFPMNDSFDTFLEQATCFLNLESNYSSDPPESGIRFCDRLSGKPVYADLFDAPREKGITSNMGMLVCGTSGGGKSMTVNHILRTLYDQGAHCVTVDIGGSYKGLCELVGGYYFTYEESNPIQFNPFYLPEGQTLDTEKKESLKALLVTLWKQEDQALIRSEYVALSNALSGYYRHLAERTELFPCFDTFYEYLENEYTEVLKAHKVRDIDFDMGSFLYVLRPYYKGGEFDYLLNARENLDLLGQRFVVIELDQIKEHPILFPVVTLIVMEMFLSKMRKLKGIRKVLTVDEAWKAIANSGMAGFLQYAFKTIRKFNGVPVVVTQELDDLISSPIIKDAIINNADIKIMMDMRKFMHKFDKLQDTLGLSDKAKTILLSVNKDNREIFVDIGGQVMKVYKNELCAEEYLAFTTEGRERVRVQQAAIEHGSMQQGIIALAAESRERSGERSERSPKTSNLQSINKKSENHENNPFNAAA